MPSRASQHAQFASVLRALRGGPAPPFRVGASRSVKHHRSSDTHRFTPEALAPAAGYVVPHPHRLIGLIRPTCRHIETSPHCGLYPMPSLGVIRLGPQVVPCFRCMFLLDMPSSRSPESSSVILSQPHFTDDTGLRRKVGTARHSRYPPPSASSGDCISGFLRVRFRYGLSSC